MRQFLKLYWQKLLLLLFLFAAATRVTHLFAALDYDEIWTLTYFSTRDLKAIFTELALPNNQPLNSLFARFILTAGLPLWCIRLHSLIAGIAAVMLMVPIGIKLGRSRGAGFWSALFLLCSAPAAAYSQLARGYELQLLGLLLYAWGLLYHREKKFFIPALCAMAAGGVMSILTLPTSVIYLGVTTLGYFALYPKLPGKALGGVLLGGVLFCALWYGINFSQFRTGQQWGTVIDSHRAFFFFGFKTLDALIPLLWCPFLFFGLILLSRRTGAVLCGGILLVLLSALITRGGGERVYIPLVVPAALICGMGVDSACRRVKRYQIPLCLAAVLCAAGGLYANMPRWSAPDWYALYAKGKAQAPGTLVIYSGTNGFPVMWNNQPDSLEENRKRLQTPLLEKMLCFSANSSFNGVDDSFSESQLPLKSKGVPSEGGFLYALEAITSPRDGDEILLVCCDEESSEEKSLYKELSKCGKFLRLNIFFEEKSDSGKVNILRGGVVRQAALFDWKTLPETIKVYRVKTLERQEK